MHWLIFGLSSVFFLSLANILQRVLMKDDKSQPVAYAVVFQFLLTFIIGLFSFVKGFQMPPLTQFPLNFLFMGMLYGFGTIFLLKALKTSEASEVTIIGAGRALVTVIFSIILLHEVYSPQKWLGTFLIILSVVMISYSKKGLRLHKGLIYTLYYALFYGLAVVNDAFLLKYSETFSYTAVSSFIPAIVILLFHPKVIFELKYFLNMTRLFNMCIMSLFYALAALSFFSAISNGAGASQMGPINQGSVILTVFLAAVFLKERGNLPLKILASALVSVGVLLLR